ncbi:MAG TPA: GTP-binding protein [Exiguobacterium sp.]|uniref:YcjF family protein n=1 Tax=Exiguobacterium sp. TaxID=44751 RepID=UPI000EB8F8ED|nr:GTP-binding protein [Exiguobacterium sp.]HCN58223.1 GTP-binding protein [Exiguobacterium sp.]
MDDFFGEGLETNEQKRKRKLEEVFDQSFESERRDFNQSLEQEVTVALIGDVNAGKSSTLNAILGREVATVGAKPGETTRIDQIRQHPEDKVVFVDTPGLNDANSLNSDTTWKFYQSADVILYFLNAAGTVLSETETKNFKKIYAHNKNIVIVVTKIDATNDLATILSHIELQLPGPKVVPVSALDGTNIDRLRREVLDILKKFNKDNLFVREIDPALRGKIANNWIVGAGTAAGAIGAVPFPGADIIPLTSIQIGLMLKLSNLYERNLSKESAKELLVVTIVGNSGKTAFRQLAKMVPGYGAVIGAGVASTATLALGYGTKYAYENKLELTPESLMGFLKKFRKKPDGAK